MTNEEKENLKWCFKRALWISGIGLILLVLVFGIAYLYMSCNQSSINPTPTTKPTILATIKPTTIPTIRPTANKPTLEPLPESTPTYVQWRYDDEKPLIFEKTRIEIKVSGWVNSVRDAAMPFDGHVILAGTYFSFNEIAEEDQSPVVSSALAIAFEKIKLKIITKTPDLRVKNTKDYDILIYCEIQDSTLICILNKIEYRNPYIPR